MLSSRTGAKAGVFFPPEPCQKRANVVDGAVGVVCLGEAAGMDPPLGLPLLSRLLKSMG